MSKKSIIKQKKKTTRPIKKNVLRATRKLPHSRRAVRRHLSVASHAIRQSPVSSQEPKRFFSFRMFSMGRSSWRIVVGIATGIVVLTAMSMLRGDFLKNVAPIFSPLTYHDTTPSALAATFADDTQVKFDAGTYSNTQWNATLVDLTATGLTNKAGNYTSNVKDATATATWDTLAWTPNAPYDKELPGSATSETAYAGGNASMTNNLALWHLNESSGSIVDSSGNSRTGTGTGITYSATGKLKTGISFDGNDKITVTGGSWLTTSTFTVGGWFKLNGSDPSPATNDEILYDSRATADGKNGMILLRDTDGGTYGSAGELAVGVNDSTAGTNGIGTDYVLPRGEWHHIMWTYSSRTSKLYIDGVLKKTVTHTKDYTNNTANNFFIGIRSDSNLGVNAVIDEFVMFSRTLSATEALDHYKRGGLRIKYQVRSCDDSACSGETLIGPDGTASDYYREVNNTGVGLPSFSITNVVNNRYFQYKAFYETDDTTNTPQLTSVTTTYTLVTISVGGTVYTDEGSTAMTTTPTVRVKVNGGGAYSAAAAANGTYTVTGILLPTSGDVVSIFLDGATEQAITVTRYTSGSPTGLNLYQNRVIVRHEDAGPITNANLDQYDNGNDTDIPFTVTAGALTVANTAKLYVWTGKTFTPGGAVTTNAGTTPGGDVFIGASSVFSVGTNAVNVGGSWDNNGTFTASSGETLTFNATSTGKIVEGGTGTYQNVTFNSSSGGWTVQTDNMTVASNLTLTAASAWTLESGRTLEVDGTFANSIPAGTTWTGSTLYLNSATAYTIGSKTQAAETYGTLQLGPGTQVRTWNSSAATVTIN